MSAIPDEKILQLSENVYTDISAINERADEQGEQLAELSNSLMEASIEFGGRIQHAEASVDALRSIMADGFEKLVARERNLVDRLNELERRNTNACCGGSCATDKAEPEIGVAQAWQLRKPLKNGDDLIVAAIAVTRQGIDCYHVRYPNGQSGVFTAPYFESHFKPVTL